ncbi:M1 family metallopeptidase [Thermicanus aegyptius]|uniref:M1 family metallopeptidase n=1 Tax=Thermicanus aegyptius TaxID=94009 RepID=UPI00048CDDB0|nr:M1 family metallopeptidase [Thermicanus aegyptius]
MRFRRILSLFVIYVLIGLITVYTSLLWVGFVREKIYSEEIDFMNPQGTNAFTQNEGVDPSPTYTHHLSFQPENRILTGDSLIQTWNRTNIPTREIHLQVFLRAFGKGEPAPVFNEFMPKVYPGGFSYSSLQLTQVLLDGEPVPYTVENADLKLILLKDWKPGEKKEIRISWKAELPAIHHRMGKEGDSFWFGNALPILAVYDGKWHSYAYEKAGDPFFSQFSDYHVEIEYPSRYTLISTGEKEERSEGEKKIAKVHAEGVREFAFALTAQHQVVSKLTEDGVLLQFYYYKLSKKAAQEGLDQAEEMLRFMKNLVGEYPYKRLTLFENEMFISGMEYPGLILLDRSKYKGETVVHEVAHQWFYNLVGNDQVMEPWLDEAIVTYYTDRFIRGSGLNDYYLQIKKRWEKDGKPKLSSVLGYTTWSQYYRDIYLYGSLMLYELEQKMGREKFNDFMKKYVAEFRGKIAHKEDFIRLAEEVSGVNLDSFFSNRIQ